MNLDKETETNIMALIAIRDDVETSPAVRIQAIQTMQKIMYVIPSDLSIKKVVITPECINGGKPKIMRDKANPRAKLGTHK